MAAISIFRKRALHLYRGLRGQVEGNSTDHLDMPLGATRTQPGAPCFVLGVGDTEQTLSCQPDGVVSGTQPVCEPVRCSAPKGASEYEDVCSDSADERSCGVSWASGYSIMEYPAVRTVYDSGTDGGLFTSEPQAAPTRAWAARSCRIVVGLFPGACCWLRNSTAWRVSCTLATVFVSVSIAEAEGAHGVAGTCRVCVCVAHPLVGSTEGNLASVPPASASHDCDGLSLQEECTATCAESCKAKLRATALTAQISHLDGCTYTDTGLQFPIGVTTTMLQCSDITIAQNEKLDGQRDLRRYSPELASGDTLRAPP